MEKKESRLYWERKAYDEIKVKLDNHWNTNKDTFHKLSLENKKFEAVILEEDPEAEIEKETIDLSHLIHELWKNDPIIFRIIYHNTTSSEDIEARSFLRKNYLSDDDLKYYRERLSLESVLEDSILAKAQNVKSLPVHLFMVGKVLDHQFRNYQHFRMIDEVKKTGASGSIAVLRETRVKEERGNIILDYSPLYKDTLSAKCVIREIFNRDDFIQFIKNDFRKFKDEIDDVLGFLINKTAYDISRRRLNIFFGNSEKIDFKTKYREITARLKFILKHGNKEVIIPLQILPKWFGDVLKIVDGKAGCDKAEGIQTASLGLYKGILACKGKGGATAYLRQGMSYALRTNIKKSLKEHQKFDFSFDEPINKNDDESDTLKDYVKDNQTPDPLEALQIKEILKAMKNDRRLWKIYNQKESRSEVDQKYYEREIKKIMEYFEIK